MAVHGGPQNPYYSGIEKDSLLVWLDASVTGSIGNFHRTGVPKDSWPDLSGNDNNFILNGGDPTFSTVGGGCWDFDGSGDYFQLTTHTTDLDPGTGDMTWETWFQTDDTDGDRYVYSNFESTNDRIELRVGLNISGTDRVSRLLINDAGTAWYRDTTTTCVASTWFHLVWCYDRDASTLANGNKCYVNGALDAGIDSGDSWQQNATIQPGSTVDTLGRRGNGDSQLDGKIAIFRIYNKALSATEVSQNYNAERGRFGL